MGVCRVTAIGHKGLKIRTILIEFGCMCNCVIKNSKSLWSTDAIGLYIVSIFSWTDVCTGFCAKMSNSELTDNDSAAMLRFRIKAVKRCRFLYSSPLLYVSQVVSWPFLLFLLF